MIPAHNQSGVIPPFAPGTSPAALGSTSPYKSSMLEVAERFSIGSVRTGLLRGLIDYRSELRKEGIVSGFQWIDGSFVEDIERNKGRPPSDIDVITFAYRPNKYTHQPEWQDFVRRRLDLFSPAESKKNYKCDAYFVDMNLSPEVLVRRTIYWFGLFSHQRDSFLWKGMLEVPLCDDTEALSYLSNGGSDAT